MSRTDKDRPYWVKVQDHGVEHHDHRNLGKEVWQYKDVLDEDGKPVIEEVPFFHFVGDILASKEERKDEFSTFSQRRSQTDKRDSDGDYIRSWYWNGRDCTVTSYRKTESVISDAMYARAQGLPDTYLIAAGTYTRRVRERYLAYTIPDHCTINDETPKPARWWLNHNPCYMEADYANDFRIYACSCSMCNPGRDHEGDRAFKRNTLKNMIKAANSGDEDWEDGFEGRNLTPPRRAGQSWW
ncbi:hypothetical protein QEH42_gp292 [Microbacterium phage Pumpernickel]|uniref:Uncharacterized protein n=1 Tax=Microbacterium phage Pumpernickel TaxID=2885983 RepID=A0AAE9C3G2_9CAUD|nr:hypothetical protein QEH42_gp292 [Microbacterium phage Pumpernickel]UDL15926.1 hypothetical protein SEA_PUMPERNICKEL_171 [Microbacterium phage Pumpernickel]